MGGLGDAGGLREAGSLGGDAGGFGQAGDLGQACGWVAKRSNGPAPGAVSPRCVGCCDGGELASGTRRPLRPRLGNRPDQPIAKSRYILLLFLKQHATPMTESTPRFGFVAFAETWNGRLAMLGFVIGLGTELLTGQGILAQIGLG